MTASPVNSMTRLHKDVDGEHVPHDVSLLDTTAVWGHSVFALAWIASVGIVAALALPAARQLLAPAALRYLDVRLENVIRLSGLFTVLLVVTGIYNLKRNTPYPTPWLSASPTEVLDLPDATPYFLVLAGKFVVYGLMLAAAAYLINQGRAHATGAPDEASELPAGGGVATLPKADTLAPATARGTRIAVGVFLAGLFTVLLSLSWLRTYHLVIEGTPDETGVLSAHSGVPQPLFTKVEVKADGAGAWLVSLTLTDHASQLPPPSVFVTVTGTGPNGESVGPLDFREIGSGVYQGRVAGPAGNWSLLAVTESRPEFEVAPVRQSFSVALTPAAAAKATS